MGKCTYTFRGTFSALIAALWKKEDTEAEVAPRPSWAFTDSLKRRSQKSR